MNILFMVLMMQDFGEVSSGKFRSGNYPVFKTIRS